MTRALTPWTLAWPLAVAVLALWTARMGLHAPIDLSLPHGAARTLAAAGFKLVIFVVVPLALIYAIERRPWTEPFGLPAGNRPVLAITVALVWFTITVTVFLLVVREPRIVPGGMPWRVFAVIVFSVLVTAIAEEVAFRGAILPRMLHRYGNLRGHAITAALFVAVHWPAWIFVSGGPDLALAALLSAQLFVFALVLGIVTVLSGTIWIAVALHAANNFIAGGVFG
jgi:membrane protease YdiL (CAAX protease family)